jgi:transposase
MIPLGVDTKVYLAPGSTDMRKAINGLSIMVQGVLELDPFSGHLFVFCNRSMTIIKILYWDRNGFCLWQKRLEKHRFKWPKNKSQIESINRKELLWLLDGIDPFTVHAHPNLNYKNIT